MTIHSIETPGLAIFTYVIVDDATHKALVIDPTRDVSPILQILQQNQAKLATILETHVHADFVSGAKELQSQFKDKPMIGASIMGGKAWFPKYANHEIHDQDTLECGSLRLQAIHTPGHTPEHLIYILNDPKVAFTGDFLFPGSIGRPDLLGDAQLSTLALDLYNSVFSILPQLDENLIIKPAHGTGSLCAKAIAKEKNSTLKKEKETNLTLQKKDPETWIHDLLQGMPKAPTYFSIVKKLNLLGVPLLKDIPTQKSNEEYLLDVRSQESFAKGHIKDSINIPFGTSFYRWMGEFIPYDKRIVIIAETPQDGQKAKEALQLIGIDNVIISENKQFDASFPMLNVHELAKELNSIEVIDVRTDEEWMNGHIPKAKHYEINRFEKYIEKLPHDKNLAFICGSGYRASIATSLAKKAGLTKVSNVQGGMQAWTEAKLPLAKDNHF